jgi:hypothetical protein
MARFSSCKIDVQNGDIAKKDFLRKLKRFIDRYESKHLFLIVQTAARKMTYSPTTYLRNISCAPCASNFAVERRAGLFIKRPFKPQYPSMHNWFPCADKDST